MDRQRDAVPRARAVSAGQDVGAMYDKCKDALYRVARSMLRGDQQHQAEDVVQEAVISVWRNPPESVISWEGLFVQAVKWKIYDLWKSSAYRHESTTLTGWFGLMLSEMAMTLIPTRLYWWRKRANAKLW